MKACLALLGAESLQFTTVQILSVIACFIYFVIFNYFHCFHIAGPVAGLVCYVIICA